MAYYRIGLGDNDSSGYTSDDGNADTDVVTVGGIQETTIDHVTATGTHATLSASDAEGDTIVYSIVSGSLPGGLSLNSSTGAITGDPTNVSASTTSTFNARATANSKTTDRTFAIVVNPTNYFGNGSDGALST